MLHYRFICYCKKKKHKLSVEKKNMGYRYILHVDLITSFYALEKKLTLLRSASALYIPSQRFIYGIKSRAHWL